MKLSSMGERCHARAMCSFREALLYCVRTLIWRRPELTKLESTMSMIRYRPPNGTAGLARSLVSGPRRRPSPPARIITRIRWVSKGSVLRKGPELKIVWDIAGRAYFIGAGRANMEQRAGWGRGPRPAQGFLFTRRARP